MVHPLDRKIPTHVGQPDPVLVKRRLAAQQITFKDAAQLGNLTVDLFIRHALFVQLILQVRDQITEIR
jgi:hypothetical protein